MNCPHCKSTNIRTRLIKKPPRVCQKCGTEFYSERIISLSVPPGGFFPTSPDYFGAIIGVPCIFIVFFYNLFLNDLIFSFIFHLFGLSEWWLPHSVNILVAAFMFCVIATPITILGMIIGGTIGYQNDLVKWYRNNPSRLSEADELTKFYVKNPDFSFRKYFQQRLWILWVPALSVAVVFLGCSVIQILIHLMNFKITKEVTEMIMVSWSILVILTSGFFAKNGPNNPLHAFQSIRLRTGQFSQLFWIIYLTVLFTWFYGSVEGIAGMKIFGFGFITLGIFALWSIRASFYDDIKLISSFWGHHYLKTGSIGGLKLFLRSWGIFMSILCISYGLYWFLVD